MAFTPTEHMLLARVARNYYLQDRSKSDIAGELGISRFRVARLLDTAKREGVVRIEVSSPLGYDTDLSDRLQSTFGLKHVVVVSAEDDAPEALRALLGQVAGDLLRGLITRDDVLGLAWARSLRSIADGGRPLAPCPVVQLTGALSGPDGSDVLELVRNVAKASGGTPHVFYAPLVAPDAASARSLRKQPEVMSAAALAQRVTVAVVGIGAWQQNLSTVYDSVDKPARDRAGEMGAVADISGALIDTTGKPLATPLSKRIIGVTGEQLQNIDTVISVAYGRRKALAVLAALRGGLVNGLVTHAGLARELLSVAHASDITLAPVRNGRGR